MHLSFGVEFPSESYLATPATCRKCMRYAMRRIPLALIVLGRLYWFPRLLEALGQPLLICP